MINRLVVWGGKSGLDSFRHVMRSFHENALKMGIDSYWFEDSPEQVYALAPGDTVIAADVTSHHLRFLPGVNYVLHNYDGSHPICQQADPSNLLRLQVWTHDASGEYWQDFRQFDKEARTLFQPWGTDLLPEEFMEPVFNPDSRKVTFVGAIWRDWHNGKDLGNEDAILELQAVVRDAGLEFEHFTQIPTEQMIEALRSARLTPAIAGGWQVENGYIPCRTLKNPSYGCLSFTNIPEVTYLVGSPEGQSISDLFSDALHLDGQEYCDRVREQQEWIAPYNYRENLLAIDRALEEGRSAPEGAPFSTWKASDLETIRVLNERIIELKIVIADAIEVIEDIPKYLEEMPDLIDVLKTTEYALRTIVLEDDERSMSANQRAKERLRHNNTGPALLAAQSLRDLAARLEASL